MPEPAAVRPRPAAQRRVGVGRLVLAQLVVVAVLLAAATRWLPLVVAVAVLAVLALVPLFLRVRGQWYTDILAARHRLRRRRRRGQIVAPGFQVIEYDNDGTVIGVGVDDHGWFVAAAVLSPIDLVGGRPAEVPLARLAALLVDGAVPVSAVQVVTWAVPAPHYQMPLQAACVASYRQLCVDLFASAPPAAAGYTWVALRLDQADGAAETDGTDDAVGRVLSVALRRLARPLNANHRVLSPEQLTASVATCLGLGTGQPVETWTSWSADGLAYVAFEVTRWPDTATADTLRELCQVPAARTVCSLELRRCAGPGPEGVALRAVVRVAAAPPRLADTVALFTDRAAQAGLRLRRLDGEHGPAGYRCAPTGGSLW